MESDSTINDLSAEKYISVARSSRQVQCDRCSFARMIRASPDMFVESFFFFFLSHTSIFKDVI